MTAKTIAEPAYAVVIRSFNRPARLAQLLGQLALQLPAGAPLWVFDDCSTVSMREPKRLMQSEDWYWVRMTHNHGKQGAWRLFNRIFGELRLHDGWTHVVFLDDDMGICRDFCSRAWEAWQSIADKSKATMTLMVDGGRGRGPCWTNVHPKRASSEAWKIQWVDGAFVCSRRALQAIDWALRPIGGRRWVRSGSVSTGVGQQLSGRLTGLGLGLYQVERSLVVHGFGPSHMNPEERSREPLAAVDFVDGSAAAGRMVAEGSVVASLATIPPRVRQLEQVVESLLPQVELIFVYLNGHEQVPKFLERPGIVVARSQQHGNRGDAGKFFWAEEVYPYHLVCDDDLLYPPDYAYRMVCAIERYERRAVVGLHGVTLKGKLESYFSSRRVTHFAQRLETDQLVHLLGTGTVGYHHSTLRVSPDDFKRRNMADIWFGLLCQQQRVPCVALARKAQWLSALKTAGSSIYDQAKHNPSEVTGVLRQAAPWKIYQVDEAQRDAK